MGGEFLREATGVDDPRCRMSLVTAPNGYPIELLEYSTGLRLGQRLTRSPLINVLTTTVHQCEATAPCVAGAIPTLQGILFALQVGHNEVGGLIIVTL
jgi:hypothetical protein